MEKQGQGALEYLLLIGGAILVAVIVISILVGLGGTGGAEAEYSALEAQCAKYPATGTAPCSTAPASLSAGNTICTDDFGVVDADATVCTLSNGRCVINRAECTRTS